MALSKEIVNANGVTTNYHKVRSVDLQDNVLSCVVDSYVSKDYRDAERSADSQVFRFPITMKEEESMGIRQLCYTKIKTVEGWTDSVDC